MSLDEKAKTMSWISHEAESLRKTFMNSDDRQKELLTEWVLLSYHQQEIAFEVERVKDVLQTKIEALQLAILTIYKPQEKKHEELKQKLRELWNHRPKKQGCSSRAGRWEEYSESQVDEWFKKFEALLELLV